MKLLWTNVLKRMSSLYVYVCVCACVCVLYGCGRMVRERSEDDPIDVFETKWSRKREEVKMKWEKYGWECEAEYHGLKEM